MKKIYLKTSLLPFRIASALLLIVFMVTGCKDDFTAPKAGLGDFPTVTATLTADDNFDIVTAAFAKTNQSTSLGNLTSGTFTIFAPSDSAFLAYFRSKLLKTDAFTEDSAVVYINSKMNTTSAITVAALNTVLTYHIISSALTADLLTGPQTFATLQGSRLSISSANGLVLNANKTTNGAKIVATDLKASNGVIHTINRVLVAPTAASAAAFLGITVSYATVPPTVGVPTTSLGNYDLFDNAVKIAGVAPLILPNTSPLPEVTVFAPTDAAFISYLGAADEAAALVQIKAMDPATLAPIIKNHIISNVRYLTSDLTDGLQLTTANGTKITAHVAGSVYTIADTNSDSADATINSANNLTNAGGVHGISVVLRP